MAKASKESRSRGQKQQESTAPAILKAEGLRTGSPVFGQPNLGQIHVAGPGVQLRGEGSVQLKAHARITLGDDSAGSNAEPSPSRLIKLTKRIAFTLRVLDELAAKGLDVDAMPQDRLLNLVEPIALKKLTGTSVSLRILRDALTARRQQQVLKK